MRFAFHLITPSNTVVDISLFDASTVSDSGPNPAELAFIHYERASTKGKWIVARVELPGLLSKLDVLTVKKIAKANLKAMSEVTEKDGLTPLVFLRAVLADRGVQVAFDPAQKKYRCVATMKEGSDAYEVLGVGSSWTIEAKDEETAVRIAKKEVANEMADKPETAGKLVGFFTGGCKVKKVVSGALPEFVKVESLAASPEEEKLAKTPVKLAVKEDADE
jgi:uncharacterized protein (UPF0212 family)